METFASLVRLPPAGFIAEMAVTTIKEIGERVREARTRAGLTQAALAEAAGVTDETISRLERGAYEPALSTVLALASVLDLDLLSARARPDVASESPLLRRLNFQLATLDSGAQAAILRIVEILGEARREADERHMARAAEPEPTYGKSRRRVPKPR